jgi:flagellar M-ring protein FliF
MQALKLLGQQLATIWGQLGLNQKIIIAASGVAMMVVLGALVMAYGRSEYSLLYGRLDPSEAGKVIAELDDMKISYRTGQGGHSIFVPRDKVHATRMQLAAKGMPKSDGIGFEIFDKPSFGVSDFQQKANYLRALQGELARTISQIDGVESARVMVVAPENRLLVDPDRRPTASVFIKLDRFGQLPPYAVNSIRFIVANSVEGLRPGNVSVSDNFGKTLSENGEENSIGALTSAQLFARRNVEKYLSDKVEGMLDKVLGPGQAVVRVSAEINHETITRTGEFFDPLGAVPRTTTLRLETNSTSTPSPGGVAGVTVNANTATEGAGGASSTSSILKNDTQTEFALSRSTSNTVEVAGGIKRITAAVVVNYQYDAGSKGLVPRDLEQLDRLRSTVRNALGTELAGDTPMDVEIQQFEFKDPYAVEIATKGPGFMTEQFEKSQRHTLLWDAAKNLLYLLLGACALVLFWRLVKGTSEELIPTGVPVGQLIGGQMVYQSAGQPGIPLPSGAMSGMGGILSAREEAAEEPEKEEGDVEVVQAAKSKLVMDFGLGQQRPERVTIEVLKQLIRENPAKMSQAARAWLSSSRADDPA